MAEPTPRPWKVGPANEVVIRIEPTDQDGPYIAMVRFSDNPRATRDIADANAEFIVEAVNGHDDLTKIRDLAVQFIKDWYASRGGIQVEPVVPLQERCEKFWQDIDDIVGLEWKT